MAKFPELWRQRGLKRSDKGSQIAEFTTGLFVFVFFALFPMINLLALGFGTGTAAFFGQQIASRVAVADSFSAALTAMKDEADRMNNSGLSKFCNLSPSGGYQSCGFDLYTVATDLNSGSVTTYGPESSAPSPYDTSKFNYEFMVRANFQYRPFCNLSAVPYIGTIPGVGANVGITNSSYRAVESPTSTLLTSLPLVVVSGGGGGNGGVGGGVGAGGGMNSTGVGSGATPGGPGSGGNGSGPAVPGGPGASPSGTGPGVPGGPGAGANGTNQGGASQ